MKIFKRTKAKKDAKIAEGIKSLTGKFKLKDKIAKANQWADKHKKRVSVITISMLMLSLIIGTWLTLTSTYNESDMMTGLSDVKPAFDGIRRIQRLKSMQVDQTVELTNKGQQLKHDLDSLVRLPVKSHKDSVDIMVKYRQLELVVKYLLTETQASEPQTTQVHLPSGHLPTPVGAHLLRHGDLQGQRQDHRERRHRLHQHEHPRCPW